MEAAGIETREGREESRRRGRREVRVARGEGGLIQTREKRKETRESRA
jgi:hypothetical protein